MMLKPRKIEKLTYKIQEEDSDSVNHFVELNGTVPSWYRVPGPFLLHQFTETIKEKYKNSHIVDWEYSDGEYKQVVIRIVDGDHHIILKTRRSYEAEEHIYEIKKNQKKYKDKEFGYLVFAELDILYDVSKGIPDGLTDCLEKIAIRYNKSYSQVYLLCQDPDSGLYTKELPMIDRNGEFEFDLDLHYGDGFAKYHELNLKRIKEQNKGIILLHGTPGTGKSFYIRRLIKDLAGSKKNILYFPNNMVDLLGTPMFNNFLIDWAEDKYDQEGSKRYGILLVIEDAERVLLKRENNPYGADGVSNILNSTDGLLNDFLNIQVLATFNSDIKAIDEAILRKKRALSIKEFGKLPKDQAQRLIDFLKINHTTNEDMALADIYSLKQDEDDKILLDDATKKTESRTIGFK